MDWYNDLGGQINETIFQAWWVTQRSMGIQQTPLQGLCADGENGGCPIINAGCSCQWSVFHFQWIVVCLRPAQMAAQSTRNPAILEMHQKFHNRFYQYCTLSGCRCHPYIPTLNPLPLGPRPLFDRPQPLFLSPPTLQPASVPQPIPQQGQRGQRDQRGQRGQRQQRQQLQAQSSGIPQEGESVGSVNDDRGSDMAQALAPNDQQSQRHSSDGGRGRGRARGRIRDVQAMSDNNAAANQRRLNLSRVDSTAGSSAHPEGGRYDENAGRPESFPE
ncbi:MAG: hypothetical protein M1825_001749 [Sarcosagium campestre]|nr:MAG: hypothetical protein M1825_001749 [Sarcosagium campestre]